MDPFQELLRSLLDRYRKAFALDGFAKVADCERVRAPTG